jgi:ubiquitin-protein ligase
MGNRDNRLMQEFARMKELREQSGFIDFVAEGDPPEVYVVTFTCRGMIDADVVGEEHVARIYLPAEFPFDGPPMVKFLTRSFHPNIAARIQMSNFQEQIQDLLRRAPDEAARKQIQQELANNEELVKTKVCLDTLDHNWSPFITLDRICIELGEMIQYKRYNLNSPLNDDAVAWARANRDHLPVDARSLLDLRALAGIRILSETDTSRGDLDIRILNEDMGRG